MDFAGRIWWGRTHIFHDDIVSGNAVCRNEEQGIVGKLIDITNLPPCEEREGTLEISGSEGHC